MGPEAQRLLTRIQLGRAHDLGRRARSTLGPAGGDGSPPQAMSLAALAPFLAPLKNEICGTNVVSGR